MDRTQHGTTQTPVRAPVDLTIPRQVAFQTGRAPCAANPVPAPSNAIVANNAQAADPANIDLSRIRQRRFQLTIGTGIKPVKPAQPKAVLPQHVPDQVIAADIVAGGDPLNP